MQKTRIGPEWSRKLWPKKRSRGHPTHMRTPEYELDSTTNDLTRPTDDGRHNNELESSNPPV